MTFKKKQSSDLEDVQTNAEFEQMLLQSFDKKEVKLSVGDKIKAEVLSVGKENTVVSTGTRFDGVVVTSELLGEDSKPKVKVGDFIEVYVLAIKGGIVNLSPRLNSFSEDRKSRLKSSEDDESTLRRKIQDQIKAGDTVKGKVTRVEDFGAFVEIFSGIEALAHVSELSWQRVQKTSDLLKAGDMVEGVILRVEQTGFKPKISITLKKAAENPWSNLPSELKAGRVVTGKVTKLMDFGAFVMLKPGLEGLIPLSAMSRTKRINKADEVVKVGDEVAVMVKDVNPDSKRISLSLKDALEEAASLSESEDIKEYAAKMAAQESKAPMGALGAKIQAALNKKS